MRTRFLWAIRHHVFNAGNLRGFAGENAVARGGNLDHMSVPFPAAGAAQADADE